MKTPTVTNNPRVSRVSRLVSQLSAPSCLIDESCGSATDLNLRTIEFAREFGAKLGRLPSVRHDDYDQIISEMADSAVDHLNTLDGLPPYCSFHFEDNSLFLTPSVECAKEDVGFISQEEISEETSQEDASYPADGFRGEWLHVSDHGNATLYVRETTGKSHLRDGVWIEETRDVEIWSVV